MKGKNGFTVIELLVVIAIITILAAIIIVNVQNYIVKSKVARANTDAQNIYKALLLFKAQYGDFPTWVDGADSGGVTICGSGWGAGCTGDPYLLDGDGITEYHLSEIYKGDFNAYYLAAGATFYIQTVTGCQEGDGTGFQMGIYADPNHYYGVVFFPASCSPANLPFRTTLYP